MTPAAAQAVALADACQDDDRAAEPAPALPAAPAPAAAPAACGACGSVLLAIQHGRFGYYFRCAGCGGTTPVVLGCGTPGHKEVLRKDGMRFYRECAGCGSSSLYFSNAE